MHKRLIPFTVIAVLVLLALPARADLITFNPLGGFTWQVVVQNVPPNTAVGGFDIDVGFDPLLLLPNFVTFGPGLGDPSLFEALTGEGLSGPGVWNLNEVSLLDNSVLLGMQSPGGFVLATIGFIPLTPNAAGDPVLLRADLADGFGNPIGEEIPTIPEPATCVLIGSGLLALARRRK